MAGPQTRNHTGTSQKQISELPGTQLGVAVIDDDGEKVNVSTTTKDNMMQYIISIGRTSSTVRLILIQQITQQNGDECKSGHVTEDPLRLNGAMIIVRSSNLPIFFTTFPYRLHYVVYDIYINHVVPTNYLRVKFTQKL